MNKLLSLGLITGLLLAPLTARAADETAAAATDTPATPTLATQKTLEFPDDPPGELTFYAHNIGGHESNGTFKKWKFTEINIPNQSYEGASLKLAVDINSMWEENEQRLAHLKNPDFFDVDIFPTALVTIHDVKPVEGKEDDYTATAVVEIRKAKAEFPVTFKLLSKEPLTVEGDVLLSRQKVDVGAPFVDDNPRSIYDEVKVHFKTELK